MTTRSRDSIELDAYFSLVNEPSLDLDDDESQSRREILEKALRDRAPLASRALVFARDITAGRNVRPELCEALTRAYLGVFEVSSTIDAEAPRQKPLPRPPSDRIVPSELIEAVRRNVPIDSVIERRVKLRRLGMSFTGTCPFHEDAGESFHVNQLQAFYYCFECQAGGNVISFVQATEQLSFSAAVRALAKRFSIEWTPENP